MRAGDVPFLTSLLPPLRGREGYAPFAYASAAWESNS